MEEKKQLQAKAETMEKELKAKEKEMYDHALGSNEFYRLKQEYEDISREYNQLLAEIRQL